MTLLMILVAWIGLSTLVALGFAAFVRKGSGPALPALVAQTMGGPAVSSRS